MLGKPFSLVKKIKDRPGHDVRYALNCRKISRLGWKPTIMLRQGLEKTVRWYATNPGWWVPLKQGPFKIYYKKQYQP